MSAGISRCKSDKSLDTNNRHHSRYTCIMNARLVLLAAFALLLSACGNRSDLLLPSDSPPEDAGRYLIKPKPATAGSPVPEVMVAELSADGGKHRIGNGAR